MHRSGHVALGVCSFARRDQARRNRSSSGHSGCEPEGRYLHRPSIRIYPRFPARLKQPSPMPTPGAPTGHRASAASFTGRLPTCPFGAPQGGLRLATGIPNRSLVNVGPRQPHEFAKFDPRSARTPERLPPLLCAAAGGSPAGGTEVVYTPRGDVVLALAGERR